jgi:hypothetical protein
MASFVKESVVDSGGVNDAQFHGILANHPEGDAGHYAQFGLLSGKSASRHVYRTLGNRQYGPPFWSRYRRVCPAKSRVLS